MDYSWARQALDPPVHEAVGGGWAQPADAGGHADDPLGDEAAFPSTWQSLDGLESSTVD
jgi:hypothetical protein